MFDGKHYVPILKWKQGEQKALEALPAVLKTKLTPLIEVPPIDWDFVNEVPKKTVDEQLENIGGTISRSWDNDSPVMIDLLYIEPHERTENGQHPLEYALQQLRSSNVNAIPVTGSDRDSSYQSVVSAAHKRDGLGVCLRLTDEDFEDMRSSIDSLLSAIEVVPEDVDLLIDYKYVNPSDKARTVLFLAGLINSIPNLDIWRNVILAGTAFPKDLSEVGANTVDILERSEWVIWKRLFQNTKLERLPIFSDYGISNPEPFEADPRLIIMSANIRYTSDDNFIIFKGRDLRKYGYDQYYQLAAQAVAHREYRSPSFSDGDNYINEVSKRLTTSGNPATWRRAGTNHHLTFVLNDLSSVLLP